MDGSHLKYKPVHSFKYTASSIETLNVISVWVLYLFIWGFMSLSKSVQVISQRVVGRAEESSTYCLSGFCGVNCRPMASNYQLSRLRPCRYPNPSFRGGRRECYHSATMAPRSGDVVQL